MTVPFRHVRRLAAVALVSTAGVGAGCASTPEVESPTGGRTLSLHARHADNVQALYIVEDDGTLSFGGGRDAWLDKTTWNGPMTQAEIAELFALVDEHDWFEKAPGTRRVELALGGLLIIVGSLLLADRIGLFDTWIFRWITLGTLVPLALVVLGLFLIVRGLRRGAGSERPPPPGGPGGGPPPHDPSI